MTPSTSRGGPQPLDEDALADRTQTEQGVFDGKIVLMDCKATALRTMSYEQRQKRWKAKSVEEKNAKFNKIFQPQSTKKWPSTMKVAPVESVVFFKNPVKGKFGMPLKKFPEQKHDHSQIVVRKKANQVDYSIDEHDIFWLTDLNSNRNGKDFLSVSIFEHWIDRLEKWSVWKPREHHKLRDEHGKELDDVCNICLDGDTSNCNQIVYCDRCNLTVHQDCYGIPFIPEGCLECRRCVVSPARRVSCVLCPSRTGAFKQVDHKRWVHVLCVIWVDETHFGNTIFMENVQNVEKALYDRKALSCMLCKTYNPKYAKHGACIQCSESKCTASFHVTCARNHGLIMRIVENDNGTVNRYVWCPRHQPEMTESDKEQHQRMLRNKQRENEKMVSQISMPTLNKSIISRIRIERPFCDFREIVIFWYQKRQNRLGAPLLKNFTPESASQNSLMMTPTKFTPATVVELDDDDEEEEEEEDDDVEEIIDEEMDDEKTSEATGRLLKHYDEMSVMVTKREEQKRDMILDSLSSIRLLSKGLKTLPTLLEETLTKLKAKDHANVFAEPVEVAGYKALIKNPICLRDMTEKLTARKYKSIAQLGADITLMLQNCAQFNVKNKYFLNYGSTFKRQTTPILEAAYREEAEINSLGTEKSLKEQLMERFLEPYDGYKLSEDPSTSSGAVGPSEGPGKRGRRRKEVKVEVKEEVLEEPPDLEAPKRGRKRANLEGPSTSSAGASGFFKKSTLKSPGIQKQTKMTSFFAPTPKPQVTFAEDTVPSGSRFPVSTPFSSSFTTSKLFPMTSSALFSSSGGSTPRITRSSAPSTTTPSTGSNDSKASKGRQNFRISSSNIQSPNPEPRRRGRSAFRSDDDEEEEIQIQPVPMQLSPEQLRAERLRSAENEAKSKFAHNQLVIVDGRAAKVIDVQLAHLSDIHTEQRQSMMKKRREVLSEIPQSALIYVEFFQKSNTLENYQWVEPSKVDLLDLNTVAQKGVKIPGLKAAREWHQKVINGDV